MSSDSSEGWQGWDEYAPFYDWENAQTLGRRDVGFWERAARSVHGELLELGCGTGRISIPLARSGVGVVGIDRSSAMLAHAASRVERLRRRGVRRSTLPTFVRGDIRALPFSNARFAMVVAAYGILQSLVRERDLASTLDSVARVLEPSGVLGIDLVPDVPNWREYHDRVQMRGRLRGRRLTLIESVRQDRRRHLTHFAQRFIVGTGSSAIERHFDLTFRTLPLPAMMRRLEKAGFVVESTFGGYRGAPWSPDADTWLILARRTG
ncbi:MAG TPA: class I SAM-dependent methyltransferase [Vicinamibacterales bacterium]|nr:class I SAM-dependent methyltransferase [Vicinamibacterales bacterium]